MYAFGEGHSDVGKRREHNEDRFVVDNDLQLYAVCDGMGGHAAGDVAAEQATTIVRREVRRRWAEFEAVRKGQRDPVTLEPLVIDVAQRACREVFEHAANTPGHGNMGCTLTMLVVAGTVAIMAHIGDSRLYLVRDGQLYQLSHDHTMAAEMVRDGGLSPIQLKRSRFRNVLTRALGTHESVQVDTLLLELFPGDGFMICSDGFSNAWDDVSGLREALNKVSRHAVTHALVAEALERDGSDNITLVTAWVRTPAPESQAARVTDIERRLGALTRAFVFRDLDLRDIATVLSACESKKYPRGAKLLEPGELCDRLIIPVYGRLALIQPGKAPVEIGPDTVLAATTLLQPRESRCGVRALEPTRVLTLSRTAFLHLARSRPQLGVELFERLGQWLSAELDADTDPKAEGPEARQRLARRML